MNFWLETLVLCLTGVALSELLWFSGYRGDFCFYWSCKL